MVDIWNRRTELRLKAGTHWKENRNQVSLKLVAEGSDAASMVSYLCISSLKTNYAVNYTTEYSVIFVLICLSFFVGI